MRNFSWGCFQVTGNIDAYLLYKDVEGITDNMLEVVDRTETDEEQIN